MAEFDMMATGRRLRALRDKRELTIDEVASGCSLSPTYVGLIEKGSRAPGRDALLRIAEFFLVSPQFLVTGELQPEDQAKVDRFKIWPEIVYLIANHLMVPRRINPARFDQDVPRIMPAVRRAWELRTYCEYSEWADSRDGKKSADQFAGVGDLERLIELGGGAGLNRTSPTWINFFRDIRLELGLEALRCRNRTTGKHEPDSASHCFASDIDASRLLYDRIGRKIGILGAVDQYDEAGFRNWFIEKAFPGVFWSASRCWSDRRMAAWLSFLQMSMEHFAPLVRTARQYESAESFSASARRIIETMPIGDQDAFLGYFPDVSAATEHYTEKGGGVCKLGGSIPVNPARPYLRVVQSRRQASLASDFHDLVDLIVSTDDREKVSELRRSLEALAPPHTFPPMGLLTATGGKTPGHPPSLYEQLTGGLKVTESGRVAPKEIDDWQPPDSLP